MRLNLGKLFVKAIGAGTVGLACYDGYKRAKWQGEMDCKNASANMMTHVLMSAQTLDSNSAVRSNAKNSFNKWFYTSGVKGYFSGVTGFVKGFVSSLADNVVPLGLACGALMFNKAGKYCAWGLGAYAAKFLIMDMCGVGKPNCFPEKV